MPPGARPTSRQIPIKLGSTHTCAVRPATLAYPAWPKCPIAPSRHRSPIASDARTSAHKRGLHAFVWAQGLQARLVYDALQRTAYYLLYALLSRVTLPACRIRAAYHCGAPSAPAPRTKNRSLCARWRRSGGTRQGDPRIIFPTCGVCGNLLSVRLACTIDVTTTRQFPHANSE
jgi:hypothetical protein